MAKCTPEQFPKVFADILNKYGDDIVNASGDVVRDLGRKTAAAVRTSAAAVTKGKYAGSWTFTVVGRVNPKAIVYSRVPGLPHLIENGHATTKGGRVAGKVHIRPVAEAAEESFAKEMRKVLENL